MPITILPGIRDAVLGDGEGTLVLGNVIPSKKKKKLVRSGYSRMEEVRSKHQVWTSLMSR